MQWNGQRWLGRLRGRGVFAVFVTITLHCTAWHCTAIYRTAHFCTGLCTAYYCTVQYITHGCGRPQFIRETTMSPDTLALCLLHCTELYFIALKYTALYYTAMSLNCTALHYNAMYFRALHSALNNESWHLGLGDLALPHFTSSFGAQFSLLLNSQLEQSLVHFVVLQSSTPWQQAFPCRALMYTRFGWLVRRLTWAIGGLASYSVHITATWVWLRKATKEPLKGKSTQIFVLQKCVDLWQTNWIYKVQLKNFVIKNVWNWLWRCGFGPK